MVFILRASVSLWLISDRIQIKTLPELLGVRDNVEELVDVAFDGEVETPVFCYAPLPNAAPLVIFFGAYGRMLEVEKEETGFLVERPLNGAGGGVIVAEEAR